jgi:glycosyltransferase involved in cell wall biosynthesis
MSSVLFVQTNRGTGNGISAYIRELTQRLQGVYDCHVLAFDDPPGRERLARYYGVPATNVLLLPPGTERAVGRTGLAFLTEEMRRRRIDLIHVHALRAAGVLALMRVVHGLAVPGIYTNHGLRYRQLRGVRRAIAYCAEAAIARFYQATVCLSERDLAAAQAARLAPSHALRVVRTRIDMPPAVARPERDVFEVVAVGPAGLEKGTDRFVEIATAVRKIAPDVLFSWIGAAGAPFTQCRDVAWPGQLDRADVLARLRAASAFLFCSRIDTYPMAVLEAYGCDLPVVFCTDCEHEPYTAPEMPQFRVSQMSNAVATILRLARAPAEHQRLATVAREWFEANASGGERFSKEYAALYRSVSASG